MPQVEIFINGQIAIVPGVYVTTQITPVVPGGQLPTGPLIFVAAGFGGVPFTPINFTDPNALKAAMRGAPSQDFVDFMFNPSSQLNGTSFVTYINVAPNTQSHATIVSSGVVVSGVPTGQVGVINMTSADYGTPSNSIQYSISLGTLAGLSMTILDGFTGVAFTGNNLGVPFQLSYVGASSGVTYSITSTIAGEATQLKITSPNLGESVTVDLTNQTYGTVSAVVQYLNGTGFYTCNVLGNGLLPSTSLDLATNIALPAPVASVDQYVNVTAVLGDIVFFINTVADDIATAVIAPGITSGLNYTPALVAQAYFSGATNGVPSLANYATGFNVALSQSAWVVFCDSNSSGVRALGSQHAVTASSISQRRWRRFVTGSVLGETAVTAETNARLTNEFMVTYCWPGIQRTNILTGLNQTYDGLHTAAAVAGMMTGNPVPTPLTNKTLLGNGIETITDLATQVALQNNGVLVLNFPLETKLPTLLSDVTTWQNDSNPANVFNQQVACRFALSYFIVRQLQPYVGTIASNFDIARAANAVKKLLNAAIYNGQNAAGILNSWDPNSLVLTFDGSTQSLNVAVSVVFVGQNRFIIVNVTVNPLNIQLSSQGVITNG